MKLCIILSLVLLASVASSAPDSVFLGPYNVSFDLGDVAEYEFTVDEPKCTETMGGAAYTEYGGRIFDGHDAVGFSLSKLDEPPEDAPDPLQVLRYSFTSGIEDSSRREIDGCPGAVLSATDRVLGDLYAGLYYIDFEDGTVQMMIISTYPWDGGTLDLLRSIHVEELFVCPQEVE